MGIEIYTSSTAALAQFGDRLGHVFDDGTDKFGLHFGINRPAIAGGAHPAKNSSARFSNRDLLLFAE